MRVFHFHVGICSEHQSFAQLMLGILCLAGKWLNVEFTTHTHLLFRLSMRAVYLNFLSTLYTCAAWAKRCLLHACLVRVGVSSAVIWQEDIVLCAWICSTQDPVTSNLWRGDDNQTCEWAIIFITVKISEYFSFFFFCFDMALFGISWSQLKHWS